MVINRALLVVIIWFGSSFAQPDAAESCIGLKAEAMVEIQYDGQVGSGIILITSNPTSCSAFVDPNLNRTLSSSKTVPSLMISTTSSKMLTLATSSHSLLPFGISRTQMINATSTGQHLFPTATGSSQIVSGATTIPNLSASSTSTLQTSLVAGSGTRPAIWSYVFFWAVTTQLIVAFL